MRDCSISVPTAGQLLKVMAQVMLVNTQGQYHVFISFSGHVNALDVRVLPSSHDYSQTPKVRAAAIVTNTTIYLELPEAFRQLQDLAAGLSRLRVNADAHGGDHA